LVPSTTDGLKKCPIIKFIEIEIPTLRTNIQMLLAIKKIKTKPIINHGSNNFIINA